MKLKYKKYDHERTVLGVYGDLYFLSYINSKKTGSEYFTLEGLKETFEIPEERLLPVEGQNYWATDCATEKGITKYIWGNDPIDKSNLANNNVFRTKAEALVAYEKVKQVLANNK